MSNSIKALKLVISAITSLKKKKGSSLQDIALYLVRKYSVNQTAIKPLIYTGLIKGMKYGLIKNELGLYRLNPALHVPLPDKPGRCKKEVKPKRTTVKQIKQSKQIKRMRKQKCSKKMVKSPRSAICTHKTGKRKNLKKKPGKTPRKCQRRIKGKVTKKSTVNKVKPPPPPPPEQPEKSVGSKMDTVSSV